MRERLRRLGSRLGGGRGNRGRAEEERLDERLGSLERRVHELAGEVQECRQLNLRLAELTDVVEQLLLPISLRDEDKVAELIERYREGT